MLKVICDHCEGVLNQDSDTVTVTATSNYGVVLQQHSCDRDVLYIVKNALAKMNEHSSNKAGFVIGVVWGKPTVYNAAAIED